jgi:hypothetical protein
MDGMVANADEPFIRLNDVPKLKWIPGRGRGGRIGLATIYRWVKKGVDGRKLRAVRIGAVWATTETWLRDFFECQPQQEDMPQPAGLDPALQRRAAAAQRDLERMGIADRRAA